MTLKTRTKAAIAVSAAALVLTTGGVAVAATSSTTTTAGHGHRAGGGLRTGRIEHGQFVTKDRKTGAQVTHDIVNGSVTAVSATAVTVKAGDGTTVSFVVSSGTKVHVKGQAKGSTSTIAAVKTGQQVLVLGTGTGPFAATRVSVR